LLKYSPVNYRLDGDGETEKASWNYTIIYSFRYVYICGCGFESLC